MRKLIGFVVGGVIGVLLVRYHILEGGEIRATQNFLDALGLKLWSEAGSFFAQSAALKLGAGLAVGGSLGAAIQYLFERQVHLRRG
jgi:uncharacterized membrane-anchored protein YhcB (DUF1043 family)